MKSGTEFFSLRLERVLHFQLSDQETTGTLFVGDIRWQEEKKKWVCHWSLSNVHPEIGQIYGDDPLDALIKTLDFLSVLIRGSENDGLIVWWQNRNDHAGILFPLSEDRKWEKIPPSYRGELPPGLKR